MTLGRWLWATRPPHQNAAWSLQLQTMGYPVIDLPLLDIVVKQGHEDLAALRARLQRLDEYQRVFFVSQNAVAATFTLLDELWVELPLGTLFYGIGQQTASAIAQHLDRWGASHRVVAGSATMDSESLLSRPELQTLAGENILICRGEGGRPLLGDELSLRGARVDYCELYERRCPGDLASRLAGLPAGEHWVPVFSGEALANLLREWPWAKTYPWAKMAESPLRLQLLLPTERVADQARLAGCQSVWVAPNASQAAMLASLQQRLLGQPRL
jgi:uroporphyrinogen-III synthase